MLVADEPVSMLDMSVRAKILQLMLDLKQDLGLTYVYITHDLASAKYFCDRVAIMYLGRVVEVGPTEEIFANPRHPYTKALLAAIPEPDPERMVPRNLPRGEIPDAASPPLGCSFHPRCPEATRDCGWESRDLRALIEEHWTRRDPETYERERDLVGDLEALDEPSVTAQIGKGGPPDVRALLDRMRAEDPDEPLWKGVDAIDDDGDGVRVDFHAGRRPGAAPRRRRRRGLRALLSRTLRRARRQGPAARGRHVALGQRRGRAAPRRADRLVGAPVAQPRRAAAASRRSPAARRMACQIASTLRSVASRSCSSGT